MKKRIAIAAYGRQSDIINNLSPNIIPPNIELINLNMLLSDLTATARQMEMDHSVDAFVASGGNASILSEVLQSVPLITLKPVLMDMVSVLREVSLRCNHTACIFFKDSSDDMIGLMYSLRDIINIKLDIYTYSSGQQLDEIIEKIATDGIADVIGGSYALHAAAQHGLYGHYMITEAGLISAICTAADTVESRYLETIQSRQLSSVLNFVREGIIATNRDDIITLFNPSAERIFGIRAADVMGKRIDLVMSSTRLHIVRRTGEKELNQLQHENNVNIITNRIPIIDQGVTIGALATFNDISDIELAEAQIRHKMYSKGLVAKYNFSDIIGSDPLMTKIKTQASRYARSDATVLITGESGTGKELFAQSIHNASTRSGRPFVAINCAAVSSQLLESELFGYEEGAFTGAKRGGKRGVFELADTGTVFLDEISEMSLETQAHILRVIEQREVMRVGSEKIRPVNIRIIAATNKDLYSLVRNGEFREDLYYRLNVLRLNIPPLRERPRDIPDIMYFYLLQYCPNIAEQSLKEISFNDTLLKHDWPGNVRELRNYAERFSVLNSSDSYNPEIIRDILGSAIVAEDRSAAAISQESDNRRTEADNIAAVLASCSGNKTRAAEKLGISRSTLWRKMKEMGY